MVDSILQQKLLKKDETLPDTGWFKGELKKAIGR